MQGLTAIMNRIESESLDPVARNKGIIESSVERKADVISSLSEIKAKSTLQLPQKPKRYSISELKNDLRRSSVSSNTSYNSGRRPSVAAASNPAKKRFKTIGNRVTNMLKVKMAFQKKGGQEDDNSPIIKIVELPKEPRFCSTLSPEAQFAMMKGYEDTVYTYLCRSYPEYKFLLRRSRTPVSISKSGLQEQSDLKSPVSNKETESDGFGDEDDSCSPRGLRYRHNSSKSDSSRVPYLSSNSRSHKSRSTSDQRFSYSTGLSRSNSLPVLVPRERQLIMTYRLQSAMDILDTARIKMGLQPLSPRIKSYPEEIKPVSDFNKWIMVWGREFQENPRGAK